MSKPHKHAALIHAWADGAEIEYRPAGGTGWTEMPTPQWSLIGAYRIKPASKLGVAVEALERIYEIGAQSRVLAISEAALHKIRNME